MFKPLDIILRRVVRRGTLILRTADGRDHRYGDGTGQLVSVELNDARLERQLAVDPQLIVGEAFMDGRLVMREGRIYDLLALVLGNAESQPPPAWTRGVDRARYLTRRLSQYNPARRSQRNVAHHYDIDDAIYDLFLDRQRQYSCAYFSAPGMDLEAAQRAKLDHISAKLALEDGHRVLDIGSGWGGLAMHLARTAAVEVDGITLSVEQHRFAENHASEQGLANSVRFALQDYRHKSGTYDRIVSIGMFEHVGVNHYGTFFRKVHDLLSDDGVALIHFIGRSDVPTITNPFIARHIFPGGYIPALSEVLPAIERSSLIVTDIEVLRLHYAETLRAWRQRFLARRAEAEHLRGERFCRMWEFYLAGSECAFRYQNLVVFQIQLAKRVGTLPITRDYIAHRERNWARADNGAGRSPPPGPGPAE